ncbi:ATP-binding protein [Adlercreutzia sp. ZJ176]|uniref:ATP-binding protein n=1 Tax=Adlercreutzia sp. ZJ176 TaxID=2709407 RepID=UPI0013E9D6E7|nr:ATP-binding protein [Adlercreutzia sp. ZJ176]
MAPTSSLFASHIGIFGNTGSGKSNTLCKFYTDCFDRMREAGSLDSGKGQFIFIDFNGEYTSSDVLCPEKKVYELDTAAKAGKQKVPVPDDFYFDLETWAILTQATEKTQRPFLRACLRTARKIVDAHNSVAYLEKMMRSFLEGYFGHERVFAEQRDDFARCMAFVVDKDNLRDSEDKVRETVEDIEIFAGTATPILRIGNAYGNSAAEVESNVFSAFNTLPKKLRDLVEDLPSIVEFCARFLFLQRWRSGSIAREHISSLIPRLENQMKEARKLYETTPGGKLLSADEPVKVFSLLDANLDQKKLVPLIIAKYVYREQRSRGRSEQDSSVHLIVDEAHNILSYDSQRESESWRDYRLETFEEIVKEGRKFGMYLTVSSQRPSDISPTIISQMHNYFIHRLVNDDDLRAVGKAVSFIDHATSSMIPVLPQGACIASGTAIPYPTQVQVDKMPTIKQPHSYDRDLATAWGF